MILGSGKKKGEKRDQKTAESEVLICSVCNKSFDAELFFPKCPYCRNFFFGSSAPGYVNGKYYVEYIDEYKRLKQENKLDEAEILLLKLIEAIEAESYFNPNICVAPAYYEYLANIYQEQKRYDKEVEIIKRFAKQRHAHGATPAKLLARLEKAKLLDNQ